MIKLEERNNEIARRYAEEDVSLAELGRQYNITRERVRQIVSKTSPEASKRREATNQGKSYEKELQVLEDRYRRRKEILGDKRCKACWRPLISVEGLIEQGHVENRTACNKTCAKLYNLAKYHLNQNYNMSARSSVAMWNLANDRHINYSNNYMNETVATRGQWVNKGKALNSMRAIYRMRERTVRTYGQPEIALYPIPEYALAKVKSRNKV